MELIFIKVVITPTAAPSAIVTYLVCPLPFGQRIMNNEYRIQGVRAGGLLPGPRPYDILEITIRGGLFGVFD